MKSWDRNHWRMLRSVLVAAVAATALAQSARALPGNPPATTNYQYDNTGNLRQTTVSCDPGFVPCGESWCVPSVFNCGGCGIACSTNHVAAACSGGSCNAGVCAAGWADCNGNKQSDGCETDLTSNVANCNACGNACSTNHVTPACSGGSCNAGVCAAGGGDCNGNKGADGCETDLNTVANCGGCGAACSGNNITPRCSAGSCESGVCQSTSFYQGGVLVYLNYADCNGNKRSDGCETNIGNDVNNCGGCGIRCSTNHVTPSCAATPLGGVCRGTCAAGWADCNGSIQADGCETSLATNPSNCGSCGHRCSSGYSCSSGVCTYTGGGGGCFAAGTVVTMADGSVKAIEDVVAGDKVLSYDVETGAVAPGVVTRTFAHPATPALLRINGTLATTPEHRFLVNGRWIAAGKLRVGDVLLHQECAAGSCQSGHAARVESVEVLRGEATTDAAALMSPKTLSSELATDADGVASLEILSGEETSYNLEVAPYQTYFVEGVVVSTLKN